jgi:hypothetical protein
MERNDSSSCVLCDDLFAPTEAAPPAELMRDWWAQAMGTALAAAAVVAGLAAVLLSGP